VFGATIIPTYSIIIAHVNDAVAEVEFVAAAGGLLLVQGIGAVVGPLIAGLAMSASPRGLSYTLVVAQILIAAWGVYRLTKRPAPPDHHKGHFLVEPPTPVGTEFAPAHSAAN
jgi:MFS family permease